MGDIICLVPFYNEIRKKYPEAEFQACFPSDIVELENSFFEFDGYIIHKSYIGTYKEINSHHFDLIILPGWVLKDSILALASNAKSIIGYINDLTFSNRYLNKFTLEGVGIKVKPLQQDMRSSHLSERPNLILKHFQLPQIRRKDIQLCRNKKPQDYAVIHAGARFEGRRWNTDGFSDVIRFLISQKYVSKIYLIGSNEDRKINQQIIQKADLENISDVSGEMSLLQTKQLIENACLFIGNDSGPMHIAAISGIPTIGLLGPNLPDISGPMGLNSITIFHQLSCSGCNQRNCISSYRCINLITKEEIINTCKEIIEREKKN